MASGTLFYRFHDFGESVLITNDFGKFQFLDKQVFNRLNEQGKVTPELLERLEKDMFYLKDDMPEEIEKAAELYNQRHQYLRIGPSVFTFVVSTRQGVPVKEGEDATGVMTPEVAEKALEMAFHTTSPQVTIVLTGNDPADAWETCTTIANTAQELADKHRKTHEVHAQVRLSRMTSDMVGEADVYGLRLAPVITLSELGKGLGADATSLIDSLSDAILTVVVDDPKACAPEDLATFAAEHSIASLDLRPLHYRSFKNEEWNPEAPGDAEYLAYYNALVDALIAKNQAGHEVMEATAIAALCKILSLGDQHDPNFRSPHGAGLGEICFSHDGHVFPDETALFLFDRFEEDIFHLGNIQEASFDSIMESDVVRSLAVASCLEGHPECSQNAFNPYSGISPVFNYLEQNDIFGQSRTSSRNHRIMGIIEHIFRKIQENDEATIAVLQHWGNPGE